MGKWKPTNNASAVMDFSGFPIGAWPRVPSVEGMIPLDAFVKKFEKSLDAARSGSMKTVHACVMQIALRERVQPEKITVIYRDSNRVPEFAFYAPYKEGGFFPIFSFEMQHASK